MELDSVEEQQEPDYTAITIIAVLWLIQIGLLYVLIAVETPLSPIVRQLMTNAGGLFAVVMFVVALLCCGMSVFLYAMERFHTKRQNGDRVEMD